MHVTGGHVQGGKTYMYKHFGGEKALFYYVNQQFNGSVGGQNHSKFFFLETMPPESTCLVRCKQ